MLRYVGAWVLVYGYLGRTVGNRRQRRAGASAITLLTLGRLELNHLLRSIRARRWRTRGVAVHRTARTLGARHPLARSLLSLVGRHGVGQRLGTTSFARIRTRIGISSVGILWSSVGAKRLSVLVDGPSLGNRLAGRRRYTVLETERVGGRKGHGLSITRRLLDGAIAARGASRAARRGRLSRSAHRGLVSGLSRVSRRRTRRSLRRVGRILRVVAVWDGVTRGRSLGRGALSVNRNLTRSGRGVRIGHRRRIGVVHGLARRGHKLRLTRVDWGTVGRRVLSIGAIGSGRRIVRRIRRGVRMRVGRRVGVDSLADRIVVNGTLDGASDRGTSRGRIGSSARFGRQVNAVMLLQVVLPRATGFASWERTLVIPFAGVYTSMSREVSACREWPGACLADMLLLGLLGCSRGRSCCRVTGRGWGG